MAKPLVFQLGESEFSLTLKKVDRSKLYGFKEVQALDDSDDPCELATLAGDGRTLIGRGGTGLGWLDADGCWRDKSELIPVDKDGNEIKPVPSSFSAPIQLFETASVEEYLEHNIRLVYALDTEGDIEDCLAELNRGTIFRFPYSYRGGLEADTAFLLTNESGEVMMTVGNPTVVEFIGMQAPAVSVVEDTDDDDGELMDFDMI
jgi:hypothetical protein